jgi:hypothetical protein
MADLTGVWTYQSFRDEPNPVPWAKSATLEVKTDRSGKVTGLLKLAPGAVLNITGSMTPAVASDDPAHQIPEGIALTGEGLGSVNRILGFFVPGTDYIVGTVICDKGDLGHQKDGTWGPFILYPPASN